VIVSKDWRVKRVRVALHSAAPVVTRVVLDLAQLQPHRIERDATHVSIGLGAAVAPAASAGTEAPGLRAPPPAGSRPASAPAPRPVESAPTPVPINSTPKPPEAGPMGIAPVPPLPDPTPPGRRPPAASEPSSTSSPADLSPAAKTPPSPPPPAASAGTLASPRDMERYRRQVSPALERFRMQQPLLASLDTNEEQNAERVQMAVEELARLRSELLPIKPPDTLRPQQDMLLQSLTLALMAARLRLEGFQTNDANTIRNAASAAAGAIMLLDRICSDVGCSDVPGR
jgi:hypothetical protein